MKPADTDRSFAGSIPQLYEQLLVPLIFSGYAADLAARANARRPSVVLEIAAGTGAATRELARVLEPKVSIVATDLNQPMIDHAMSIGTSRLVDWRQADAMQLPFQDESFDLVVCQFGAMFFPDKARAFGEARRVLRPGGSFLFSVWDRIETNDFADEVTNALADLFLADPPRFLARTPHGYHDPARIAADLDGGGFGAPGVVVTRADRSRAHTPMEAAAAYCHGTPLRGEIEARGPSALQRATELAAEAIARRFGPGPVDGAIQALVVSVTK